MAATRCCYTAIAFSMTRYGEPKPFPPSEAAAAFVHDYETAKGRRFGSAERAVVAAAATHALTYTARCEHARDPAGEPTADSARRAMRAYRQTAQRCQPDSLASREVPS
jgi:hypothetical protein